MHYVGLQWNMLYVTLYLKTTWILRPPLVYPLTIYLSFLPYSPLSHCSQVGSKSVVRPNTTFFTTNCSYFQWKWPEYKDHLQMSYFWSQLWSLFLRFIVFGYFYLIILQQMFAVSHHSNLFCVGFASIHWNCILWTLYFKTTLIPRPSFTKTVLIMCKNNLEIKTTCKQRLLSFRFQGWSLNTGFTVLNYSIIYIQCKL